MSKNKRIWINTKIVWQWDEKTKRLVEIKKEGYWWDGPVSYLMGDPNLVQTSFAAFNDDGSLTTATQIGSNNANWTQQVDTVFRVRFEISETAGNAANNNQYVLYYSTTASTGPYSPVLGSSVVQVTTSANVADGTALATADSHFGNQDVDGEFDSNASVGNVSLTNEQTEMEYCLTIDSAQVTDGDSIWLRVFLSGGTSLNSYTNTPQITVYEPVLASVTGINYVKLNGALTAVAVQPPTSATATVTCSGSLSAVGTKAPTVWLNSTQTLSGATQMTVTAWNEAGTSVTFTDPTGAPTGSLFLGVTNENAGGGESNTGWIAVTVNAAGGAAAATITASGDLVANAVSKGFGTITVSGDLVADAKSRAFATSTSSGTLGSDGKSRAFATVLNNGTVDAVGANVQFTASATITLDSTVASDGKSLARATITLDSTTAGVGTSLARATITALGDQGSSSTNLGFATITHIGQLIAGGGQHKAAATSDLSGSLAAIGSSLGGVVSALATITCSSTVTAVGANVQLTASATSTLSSTLAALGVSRSSATVTNDGDLASSGTSLARATITALGDQGSLATVNAFATITLSSEAAASGTQRASGTISVAGDLAAIGTFIAGTVTATATINLLGALIGESVTGVEGRSNYYLTADTNTSKFNFAGGDATIEFLYRAPRLGLPSSAQILSKRVGTAGWEVVSAGTNHIQARFSDGTVTRTITALNVVFDDENIHHCAVVLDRNLNELRIYVDGTEAATEVDITALGSITNSDDLLALGGPSDTEWSYGLVSEIRVWNDVRTLAEIQDNRDTKMIGNETNLIALWPCQGPDGVPVTEIGTEHHVEDLCTSPAHLGWQQHFDSKSTITTTDNNRVQFVSPNVEPARPQCQINMTGFNQLQALGSPFVLGRGTIDLSGSLAAAGSVVADTVVAAATINLSSALQAGGGSFFAAATVDLRGLSDVGGGEFHATSFIPLSGALVAQGRLYKLAAATSTLNGTLFAAGVQFCAITPTASISMPLSLTAYEDPSDDIVTARASVSLTSSVNAFLYHYASGGARLGHASIGMAGDLSAYLRKETCLTANASINCSGATLSIGFTDPNKKFTKATISLDGEIKSLALAYSRSATIDLDGDLSAIGRVIDEGAADFLVDRFTSNIAGLAGPATIDGQKKAFLQVAYGSLQIYNNGAGGFYTIGASGALKEVFATCIMTNLVTAIGERDTFKFTTATSTVRGTLQGNGRINLPTQVILGTGSLAANGEIVNVKATVTMSGSVTADGFTENLYGFLINRTVNDTQYNSQISQCSYVVDNNGTIKTITTEDGTKTHETYVVPNTAAQSTPVYARATVQSGPNTFGAALNTWLALTVDREWYQQASGGQGFRETTILVELSEDQSTIKDSATITLKPRSLSQSPP